MITSGNAVYVCLNCRHIVEGPKGITLWCRDCEDSNVKGHPQMRELKGRFE